MTLRSLCLSFASSATMKNSKWKQWIDFYNEIDSFVNVKKLKRPTWWLLCYTPYRIRVAEKLLQLILFLINVWHDVQICMIYQIFDHRLKNFAFHPIRYHQYSGENLWFFPPIFFRVNGHSSKLKFRLQSGFDENFMQMP